MLVVSHNLTDPNANRTTGLVSRKNQKTTERLSNGYRINQWADDGTRGTVRFADEISILRPRLVNTITTPIR